MDRPGQLAAPNDQEDPKHTMSYLKKRVLLAFGAILLGLAVLLARGSLVLDLAEPGDPIGGVGFKVLNPFRDRRPERLADIVMVALKEGNILEARRHFSPSAADLSNRESEFPLTQWRLIERTAGKGWVELTYRTSRNDQRPRMPLKIRVERDSQTSQWAVVRWITAY